MSETLIGQIPEHWETLSLGELCTRGGGDIQTGPFGSQLHASDYVRVGIPSVMPQNIGDNVIIEDGIARISPEDAKRLKRYLLAPGDIVYSRRGDVQRRALVRAEQSGWLCGTGCLRIRLGTGANSRFLSYYLSHPEVRSYIVRHAIGATMPNLNTQILSAVPVVLPPRPVQQAIAVTLGALDDKIAVNERVAATALELAGAHYAGAASRWRDARPVPLGEAARWLSGGTPKTSEPKYWNGQVPWISASSLHLPWIDDSPRKLTSIGVENGTRAVPAETIIFIVRGMSLKSEFRIGITQREVAFGQDCKALIANQGIDPYFLFYSIRRRTVEVLKMVDEAGHGTGRLQSDRLARLIIPVPDSEEQEEITARLRPLSELSATRQRESGVLVELRDTLLPKLISGELRMRDAERAVEETV